MRKVFLACLVLFSQFLLAEGTRELAPNEEIFVNNRATTDIAAIQIGAGIYGEFAEFGNDESARLNFRIIDPSVECLLFGFSVGQNPFNGRDIDYRIHIFDPNGNEIFVSEEIEDDNANIETWREAYDGPQQLGAVDGYDAFELTSADLMSAGWTGEGDYYIEFERRSGGGGGWLTINFWDITVIDCSQAQPVAKPGRVWSESWSIFSPRPRANDDTYDRPFNGSFFIAAPDPVDPGAAFITKMDFNGSDFRGAAFSVALNSFGASMGTSIEQNRRSVFDENSIIFEYPVFLNDPVDLFRTGEIGQLSILGAEGCLPESYCILALTTEPGEIEILLDLEGNNGVYDENSRDVLLPLNVDASEAGEEVCIPWDGLDGRGNVYPGEDLDSITIVTSFRQGIYHFPVYDVEYNLNGFKLESVRPGGPDPLLYYDDRDINFNSETGSPRINLAGCETPCHTWSSEDPTEASYGNENTLNSWWFAQSLGDSQKVGLKYSKRVEINQDFCQGESIVIGDSVISEPGLYEINYVTRLGCDSVISAQVNELIPEAVIEATELILNCDHPSIELNATSSVPSANISYEWQGPMNASILNANAEAIEIDVPGTYSLFIEESILGCRDGISIEITENFTEPEISAIDVPTINCYKSNRTIQVELENDVASHSAVWSTENGSIVSDFNILNLVVNDQGRYVVTIELDETGCQISDTVDVAQDTTTYNSLDATPDDIYSFCELVSLQLDIASPHYDSIRWYGNEGLSCNDCESPDFLTANDASWNVVLTDTNGCLSYTTLDLVIDEAYKIYLPNAFSPNNDGINDSYKMFSAQCPVDVVEFVLYDRWGKKVFERYDFMSTDDIGWNGMINEKASDAGVFIYRILIRTFKEEVIPFEGEIHLMK